MANSTLPKYRQPQDLQQVPATSSCDTRLAFQTVELIGMPTEISAMLCPYEDSTPAIRRAKARIIARAYRRSKS